MSLHLFLDLIQLTPTKQHLDPSLRNRYNALGKKYQTKYRKDMEMWLDRQRAIHQKAINARQQATRRLNEYEIADYIKRLRESGVIRPWSPVDKKHSGHVTGEAPSQDVDDICTAKETLSSDGCSGDDSFSQETTCGSIVLDCDDLGRGLLVTDGIYWTANQTTEFQLAGDDAFGSTVEAHTGEAGWDFLEDSQDFRIFPHESA